MISTDRFATLVDVFVEPLSSRKLLGETWKIMKTLAFTVYHALAPFSKALKKKRKERRNHAGKRTKNASTRRSRETSENASKFIQQSNIFEDKSLLEGLLGTPGGRKATDESTKSAITTQSERQERPKSRPEAVSERPGRPPGAQGPPGGLQGPILAPSKWAHAVAVIPQNRPPMGRLASG